MPLRGWEEDYYAAQNAIAWQREQERRDAEEKKYFDECASRGLTREEAPEARWASELEERDNLTFLVTKRGKPFGSVAFSTWFRKACNAAGLPSRCCAHGLRKAAARRLAEAGCSTFEVAAITGHASLRELERCTKAVAQGKLAESAMAKVAKR